MQILRTRIDEGYVMTLAVLAVMNDDDGNMLQHGYCSV